MRMLGTLVGQLRRNESNAIGSSLSSLGIVMVIAAMYTHRNWSGIVGIALFGPGIILQIRYVCDRTRLRQLLLLPARSPLRSRGTRRR
jgi:4-hydroxybenzoate polyprenyltransferase